MSALDASRMPIALFSVALLTGFGLSTGCRRGVDKAKVEELRESLDVLQRKTADLKTKFMALRKQVDGLPTDLPDFPQFRETFYATEEGRGITDTKVMLLAGRLDAAASSGNSEELQQVSKDVAQTYDDIRKIDELYVKLLHGTMSFQRQAAAREKEAAAEPAGPPPDTKAKRPKSKL